MGEFSVKRRVQLGIGNGYQRLRRTKIGRWGGVNIEDASTLFEDSVIFWAFEIVGVVA